MDSKAFEETVLHLVELLGFSSYTLEKTDKDGEPDNFWRIIEYDFINECKNTIIIDVIKKRDLGQISKSLDWYKNNYEGNINIKGIFFHPSNKLANDASSNTKVKIVNQTKI